MNDDRLVLVLGASGYVGGRLVPHLLEAGHRVRCIARTPGKLAGLPWSDDIEVVKGDLMDRDAVVEAFADVGAAYHLVHSMSSPGDFADRDRRIARYVARAAELQGAKRLIYLGGLGEVDEHTSPHLRSRAEVGEILADSTVPTTILRAAVIIGSGSASFEMLRHLVEKLPIMITPRWVDTRTQPIAIRDVLRYLTGVLEHDDGAYHVYDVGGPHVLTYRQMMQAYADVVGLPRRLVVPVPVLTPGLSSHWVNLVTPVPRSLAKPLIQSLTVETVVRDDAEDIRSVVPGDPMPYEQALRLAIGKIRDHDVETSWRDADLAGRSPADPYPGDPEWTGGTLLRDVRTVHVDAAPSYVFAAISRIGGEAGWPTFQWAWQIRGRLDRLAGGVGLRRGRRDPERLRVGDALDFWRVEDVRQDAEGDDWVLRLRMESLVPGRAWLEFRICGTPDGGSDLSQRALYAPKGLLGRAYWWALLPFHGFIFPSMAKALADAAELLAAEGAPPVALITAADGPVRPHEGLVAPGAG